jgi:uncharacterized alkaline shock family protein YloU
MSEQGPRGGRQQESPPPQTALGNTAISESVVAEIAGTAAQEVDGIRMGSGASQAVGGILGSMPGGSSSQTQGVSVEVGQEETALDLTLTAEYGKSIPQLAEAVRRNVTNRVESLVGLRVTEVNVLVNNVYFPELEQEQERQRELEQQRGEPSEQGQGAVMTPDPISLLAANATALKTFETVAKARAVRFKDLRTYLGLRKEEAEERLSQLEDAHLIKSQEAPEQEEAFKIYYITAEGLSTERLLQSSGLSRATAR